ncbi:MAG TPA: cytochrome D1 domain-containing protein [Candidatus Limnocylindria bacterium]|nr:cytochrome D1 domain-containing protein [Candidatus Limnocylindria bacterium]
MRALVVAVTSAVVLASCASARVAPPKPSPTPDQTAAPVTTVAASPMPSATPEIRLYAKLRVFVASESTDQVWVMEATPDGPYTMVTKIPVGRMPHQMAVSPDGRFVAVNNRMANTTSIIDPIALKEIIRIPVGKQPHGISFSVDSRTLYVAHERDSYILAIDTATWTSTALVVGVPQHVLAINAGHPSELWFTVTNSSESDVLRVIDTTTKEITKVKVGDVHDAYFTPDGSEIWSSSSGFLNKPSDRMVIYDPRARKVKEEIHFAGHYPFHTLKPLQDGMYVPEDTGVMVLSDHLGPGLLWVDWRERRIVGETTLGQQPFHSTYDPEGDRLLVTTNVDGMVNVIDLKTRRVVQKVPVTKAHGIVSVGIKSG